MRNKSALTILPCLLATVWFTAAAAAQQWWRWRGWLKHQSKTGGCCSHQPDAAVHGDCNWLELRCDVDSGRHRRRQRTVGTISTAGLYTPPATPGTAHDCRHQFGGTSKMLCNYCGDRSTGRLYLTTMTLARDGVILRNSRSRPRR